MFFEKYFLTLKKNSSDFRGGFCNSLNKNNFYLSRGIFFGEIFFSDKKLDLGLSAKNWQFSYKTFSKILLKLQFTFGEENSEKTHVFFSTEKLFLNLFRTLSKKSADFWQKCSCKLVKTIFHMYNGSFRVDF